MHRRLVERDLRRHFVCLTFDDGYRDNLEYAYPMFKQYQAPFAIYVATSFPDRLGELWWLALEAVVRAQRSGRAGDRRRGAPLRLPHGRGEMPPVQSALLVAAQPADREGDARSVRDLAARYRVDLASFCDELCMAWERARGARRRSARHDRRAHGQSRDAAQGAGEEVRAEMQLSQAVIEAALGKKPEHFAYPFGDAGAAGPREFGSPPNSDSRRRSRRGPACCSASTAST